MSAKRQGAVRGSQKRRTRSALLAAAAELMHDGRRPTVAEVAEAADISRRTAYRYFPTQDQLLAEAALETLRPTMERSFSSLEADPEARLEACIRAMQEYAAANEHLLRTMIRVTIERGSEPRSAKDGPLRGSRRIDWLESALAPVRKRLAPRDFARLVSAVALCVGAEALIVLRDVRGLDVDAAADVSSWAARNLLRGALADAKPRRQLKPRALAPAIDVKSKRRN